jgi:hypothetical protein
MKLVLIKMSSKLKNSMCLITILEFMTDKEKIHLQILGKRFYEKFVPLSFCKNIAKIWRQKQNFIFFPNKLVSMDRSLTNWKNISYKSSKGDDF